MKKEIILFTVIEGDGNNINNNTNNIKTKRLYEQEAIKCFQHWRKLNNELKDIKIIAYAPSKNIPSKKTISKLKDLNVEYIQNYLSISEQLEYGFFLVPMVGEIIEKMYPDAILIHTDLDMNIIKPIPEKYFDENTYIGQYDDIASLEQCNHKEWGNPFDTGFTISPSSNNFYKIFWKEFKELYFTKKYLTDPDWLEYNNSDNVYYLEEFLVDKLYYKKLFDLKPIINYQVGEGYCPVQKLSDSELNNVLFWHEHLELDDDNEYKYSRIRQKIEFYKRIEKIKKDKKC